MMLLWKKQEHSRCPLCGEENEDVHHMMTCTSVAARNTWESEIQSLQESLESIDTSPCITCKILRQLRHWRKYPNHQPLEPESKDDWELQKCV